MGSNKYVGYVGGVAVAVGVGAAIAAAGQGTAAADSGRSDSAGGAHAAHTDAGPAKSATGTTARTRPRSALAGSSEDTAVEVSKVPAAASVTASKTAAVQAVKVDRLATHTTGRSARSAAATVDSTAADASATTSSPSASASESVPWSPNPLRPMPPEPAPNDMPGVIWSLEEAVVNAFPDFFKPLPREIFEGGYRLSQMIPWVNVVVPLSNVGANLQAALAGDKAATQRIVNNLIITIEPVAILYYGFNEIADLVNLEQQGLDLQTWIFTTAWDVLDPFQLLHNRGESGLPLSTTTPPPYPPTNTADVAASAAITPVAATGSSATVKASSTAAAAETPVTDQNPFRADDPWPTTMPDAVLAAEKNILAAWPAPLAALAPLFREGYEAAYRASQIVPWVNVVVPLTNIVPALVQAFQGDRAGAQVTINQLLLTTGPVSLLYWGFDELADLLNIETTGAATRQNLVATLWDSLDPSGLLHVPGESGIA